VAGYRLFIKPSAVKEIESISSRKDRRMVVAGIQGLADDPRPPGCRKISGSHKYRLRQGRYRILYRIEVDTLIVVVVKVGDRKDVYR
jgi:mRNA interferase RelE/StbE